jgi:hypothetical protein
MRRYVFQRGSSSAGRANMRYKTNQASTPIKTSMRACVDPTPNTVSSARYASHRPAENIDDLAIVFGFIGYSDPKNTKVPPKRATTYPSVAITLTVLGLNLTGDGCATSSIRV